MHFNLRVQILRLILHYLVTSVLAKDQTRWSIIFIQWKLEKSVLGRVARACIFVHVLQKEYCMPRLSGSTWTWPTLSIHSKIHSQHIKMPFLIHPHCHSSHTFLSPATSPGSTTLPSFSAIDSKLCLSLIQALGENPHLSIDAFPLASSILTN